jgi:hypothetical protein
VSVKPMLLYATSSLRPLEIFENCARLRFHLVSVAVRPAVEVFTRTKICEPMRCGSTSDMETKESCGAVWPWEFKSKGGNS